MFLQIKIQILILSSPNISFLKALCKSTVTSRALPAAQTSISLPRVESNSAHHVLSISYESQLISKVPRQGHPRTGAHTIQASGSTVLGYWASTMTIGYPRIPWREKRGGWRCDSLVDTVPRPGWRKGHVVPSFSSSFTHLFHSMYSGPSLCWALRMERLTVFLEKTENETRRIHTLC